MMTKNRLKMLATMKQRGDCAIQELADAAGVAYQTAWRWIEQELDRGNVEKVYQGAGGGKDSARFAWAGESEEQAATLLYRARDHLAMVLTDDAGAVRLVRDIDVWMHRNDAMANDKAKGREHSERPA